MTQPMAVDVDDAVVASASSRWTAMREPGIVAGIGLLGAIALHLRDPHAVGSWGLCPFRALTGLWCPGCGGLRAINDLTHLDVPAALSSNVLVVVLVVVVGIAWIRWTRRRWHGDLAPRMLVLSPRMSHVVPVAMGVFTILRNLPVGAILVS